MSMLNVTTQSPLGHSQDFQIGFPLIECILMSGFAKGRLPFILPETYYPKKYAVRQEEGYAREV